MNRIVALLLLACTTTACEPSQRAGDTAVARRAAEGAAERRPDTARRDTTSLPPTSGDERLIVVTDSITVAPSGDVGVLRVPFTYLNRGSTPVANPGCNPPGPPMIEWWDGTAWTPAHLYGSAACRSRPYVIAPGARHAGAAEARIPRDSAGLARARADGTWRAPLDAWLRLSWNLVEPTGDPAERGDGRPVPDRERTSAAFRTPVAALAIIRSSSDARVQDSSLSSAMTRGLRDEGLVGAVWAAVHTPNVVRLGAAGLRRADSREALQTGDRIQVGSVAKTLIATGVLRLVTEGRLSLDAPLEALLPSLTVENPWAGTRPLRLRHLLDHTSGLDDARLWQLFNSEPRPDTPLEAGFDRRRLQLRVRHPPGERFSYSNTGYGILGLVIERVTGQRYEAYLDAHLLAPLGMTNSTFSFVTQEGPGADPRLAMGHFEEGKLAPAVPTYLRPAMQFTTTAGDMARLAAFLMSDGRVNGMTVVDPALLRSMGSAVGTEAARAGLPIGYALGLSIRDRHGVVGRCHAGNTVGYRAMLCLYPDQGKAFFIAMNADSEDANYVRLDSLVIATLQLSPTPRPAPRPAAVDVREWHGTYVPSPARFEMFAYLDVVLDFARLTTSDGETTFQPFQAPRLVLQAMGGSLLRAHGRTLPSHALLTTADGTRAISDGLRTFERISWWRIVPLWISLGVGVLAVTYVLLRGLARAVRRRLRVTDPLFPPFLAVVAILATVGLLTRQSLLYLGATTAVNVLLAVTTSLLPIAVVVGLWLHARRPARDRWARADAFALIGVLQWSAVLAAWGLLPLRLWS